MHFVLIAILATIVSNQWCHNLVQTQTPRISINVNKSRPLSKHIGHFLTKFRPSWQQKGHTIIWVKINILLVCMLSFKILPRRTLVHCIQDALMPLLHLDWNSNQFLPVSPSPEIQTYRESLTWCFYDYVNFTYKPWIMQNNNNRELLEIGEA